MNFREMLRNIRKKKGMKIRELAKDSNVSASYISMLENGQLRKDPSEETITKLEKALGVKTGTLLAVSTTAGTVAFKKVYTDLDEAKVMRLALEKLQQDPDFVKKILKET
jgi:transcriptional regulator with XRE-family HTH domain